jgi:hypothetical protein
MHYNLTIWWEVCCWVLAADVVTSGSELSALLSSVDVSPNHILQNTLYGINFLSFMWIKVLFMPLIFSQSTKHWWSVPWFVHFIFNLTFVSVACLPKHLHPLPSVHLLCSANFLCQIMLTWNRIIVEPRFYLPVTYDFPSFATFFSGPFNFPIFIMYCLPWFYVSKIPNFPWFTSLEHLQRKQFWHEMASTERLLVSTCFVNILLSPSN